MKRSKDRTIPLSYVAAAALPISTILAGSSQAKGVIRAITENGAAGDWSGAANEIGYALTYGTFGYTSYDGHFDWTIAARNIAAIVAASFIHRMSRPLNRKLKNVPYIGKYVSI
jgi:hypothetical protein